MRVSQAQMALNRRAILDAAGRLIRERGVDSVSISDIMQSAGLTHGGFYGHFESKDELVTQALDLMARQTERPDLTLEEYCTFYLADKHALDLSGSCPFASLASEAVRFPPASRRTMTEALERIIANVLPSSPGAEEAERKSVALTSFSTAVGAVVLSRLVDNDSLSNKILEAARMALVNPHQQQKSN